jgi:hypothetical protein
MLKQHQMLIYFFWMLLHRRWHQRCHAEETTISGHRPFMGGTQKRDYNPTRLCAELNGDAQEEFAKIGLQGRAVDQR